MSNNELNEAKKILNILQNKKSDWYNYTDRALEIINEYDDYGEFFDEEIFDELVKREAEQGAQRVMCFLADCNSLNPPYGWMLDGYGNAKEVHLNDIILKLDDIIKNNQ